MLAYSSVAQIGYITLGIGLANQAGLTGGLVHVVNHALMKAALFLAVGAIFYPRPHRAAFGACGHRPQDAAHHGGVHDRRFRPRRHAGHVRLHLQMVSGGRRARQRLVGRGLPDRGELADRAGLCRPGARSRLAARAVAGNRGGERSAALHAAAAHRAGGSRRSISASTPNGRRESPARPPRACSEGCDDGGPVVRKPRSPGAARRRSSAR